VDHYFWEKELIELVHIFSHRPHDAGLNRLTIGVARINASLFDLFATRLPGLAKLNLVLAANSIEEPFVCTSRILLDASHLIFFPFSRSVL
jgi:hypothetical protein